MPDVTPHAPMANRQPVLRGDYDDVAADWTVDQNWGAYGATDHRIWRTLFERQMSIVRDFAAPEFLDGLARLEAADGVPRFDRASERLHSLTGWTLVAVPGLIPDAPFFAHLAARRFPVTVWIRRPDELDYLVEPDVFHDFFGHVPLLSDPVFADYLQSYGEKGAEAIANDGLKPLARLYWYMVEFGLVRRDGDLRAYGAGILSSAGETVHSLEDPRPLRLAFDRDRVMRTDYRIDDFQQTYFVVDDFAQLFRATEGSFADLYRKIAADRVIAPGERVEGDRPVPPKRPSSAADRQDAMTPPGPSS
jgi:phenylalanine-4-hydroxylase